MSIFKKIENWAAANLGVDGLLHLLVSLVGVMVLALLMPLGVAVLAVLALGALKELVWDLWLKKGTAQWKDLACGAAGALLGALMALIASVI